MTPAQVAQEIKLLIGEIKRLGTCDASGQYSVKFGVIVKDDRCANIFEALVGTLKAAKKAKVVNYASELLLQGVSDQVDIVLLVDDYNP
ncbi:costars family protein [Polychytrium aggregatum]|uniref:costars family protein n=1 Tax=Polychytrium aggregatum TaxID=110093 RepID=UPI0022FDB535|nr:costars family protein [Polychytrium aggregatum]KAI9204258.1 costars family protein [Polychytrium aggregatum]